MISRSLQICVLAAVLMPFAGCTPAQRTDAQLAEMDLFQRREEFFRHTNAYSGPSDYAKRIRADTIGAYTTWTDEGRRAVLESRVVNGMDDDQVLWAWGRPLNEYRDKSPYGEVVRWHFTSPYTKEQRSVTFVNGRVAWWSDAR